MKKGEWIEGILLLSIAIGGMMEGFRLVIYKDPRLLYDIVGPGNYILGLSISLLAIGIAYMSIHYKKGLLKGKVKLNSQGMRHRMLGMFCGCLIYIFLLHFFGFLLSTIVFFLIEFRVTGIKTWRLNALVSVTIALFNYLIFVWYCQMVFPRSIISIMP